MTWFTKPRVTAEPVPTGRRRRDNRTCRWVRERLWAFLESELPQAQRAAVEAHLTLCPACARDQAATGRALASLAPARQLETPQDAGIAGALAAAVAARLAERASPEIVPAHPLRALTDRHPTNRVVGWAMATALAAFTAAATLSGALTPSRARSPQQSVEAPRHPQPRLARNPAAHSDNVTHRPLLNREAEPRPEIVRRPAQVSRFRRSDALARLREVATHGHTRHGRHGSRQLKVPSPIQPRLDRDFPILVQQLPTSPDPRGASNPQLPEGLVLIQKAEPSAPSYAFARGVLPAADGEPAAVVEVTREQAREEAPVQVTLVVAAQSCAATKETVP